MKGREQGFTQSIDYGVWNCPAAAETKLLSSGMARLLQCIWRYSPVDKHSKLICQTLNIIILVLILQQIAPFSARQVVANSDFPICLAHSTAILFQLSSHAGTTLLQPKMFTRGSGSNLPDIWCVSSSLQTTRRRFFCATKRTTTWCDDPKLMASMSYLS